MRLKRHNAARLAAGQLRPHRAGVAEGDVARSAAIRTGPGTASRCCSSDLHGCPCGYYGDASKPCSCSASTVARYQRRISGPLLDRMDIYVEVPRVEYEKLAATSSGEPSSAVRERVETARRRQTERFSGTRLACNAEMTPVEVRKHCQAALDEGARSLVRLATDQLGLSARAFHRTLKLARTVADLGGSEGITAAHVAEAVQYRYRSLG